MSAARRQLDPERRPAPARPHGASVGRAAAPLRLLVFTSLYPNAIQPGHGVFVEERLRQLVASGRVTATVVAPVPWFPFRDPHFGVYARYAQVPSCEQRHGITVHHPRYPVIPKIGMNLAPWLLTRALRAFLERLQATDGEFDLLDAHYLHPDGVAAVRLGRILHKPVVVTARGSDVTILPRYRWPRGQIRAAARQAGAVVTVSRALKVGLVTLGLDPARVTVLRNGVDLDRFAPCDRRQTVRAQLGVAGTVWLAVGHLIPLKGVHLAIEALAQVPGATLLVVGCGPERARLQSLAARLGVASRVQFPGAVPQSRLRAYYNAADVLVHASAREGMPNVVLEAMACGTPVLAAPFAGVEELVNAPAAGEVAAARSVDALVAAWQRLHARAPSREATRRHARALGWAPVVAAQLALYGQVRAAYAERMRDGVTA